MDENELEKAELELWETICKLRYTGFADLPKQVKRRYAEIVLCGASLTQTALRCAKERGLKEWDPSDEYMSESL